MSRFLALLIALLLMGSPSVNGGGREPETQRILYLGDSLSMGAFGRSLDRSMRAAGFEVYTVVAGGASPYYWLKQYHSFPSMIGFWERTPVSERRIGEIRAVPKLEDLLAEHRPHLVVVQTGINLYAPLRSKRRSKEENVKEVTSLIEQMCRSIQEAGARSYWILPPHSHEERYPESLQEELASIMSEVVGRYRGETFESRKVTRFTDPYPATDGIHYGPAEAQEWAEKVASDFHQLMKSAPVQELRQLVRAEPLQTQMEISREDMSGVGAQAEKPELPDELELRLRLVEKSEIHNLSELDYANALGVYEYEVVEDFRGNYPYDRVRIAQGIVFGRKYTSAAQREIGAETALKIVPLTRYPALASWQIVDDLRMNLDLPIYTPKLD